MGISVISTFAASAAVAASSSSNALSGGMPGEFAALLSGEIRNLTELLPGQNGRDVALANLVPTPASSSTLPTEPNPPHPLLAKLDPAGIIATLPGKAEQALQLAAEGLDRRGGLAALLPEKADKTIPLPTLEVKPGLETDPSLPTEIKEDVATGVDPALIAALTGNPALQPKVQGPQNQSFELEAELPGRRIAGDFANVTKDDSGTVANERNVVKQGGQDFSRTLENLVAASSNPKGVNLAGNEAANLAVETAGDKALDNATLNNSAAAISNTNKGLSEARSTHQTTVTPHLQENNWSQHFGEKVVWLAKSDQQSAQININPPQLGPIQIRLNLSGDQATMTFASPHLDVRQAIENAMPQLKEMLSSAGINLGQADVGANMAQHKQETPFHSANGKRGGDENAILPANDIAVSTGTSPILQRGRGLVDLFA